MSEKGRKIHIVGIGASAGGIEAITQLVSHFRVDLPCTYVVLQHISPDYRSMMAEILGRETQLNVNKEQFLLCLQDQMLESKKVYFIL